MKGADRFGISALCDITEYTRTVFGWRFAGCSGCVSATSLHFLLYVWFIYDNEMWDSAAAAAPPFGILKIQEFNVSVTPYVPVIEKPFLPSTMIKVFHFTRTSLSFSSSISFNLCNTSVFHSFHSPARLERLHLLLPLVVGMGEEGAAG